MVLFVGNEFSSNFGFASKKDFIFEVLDSVNDMFKSFKPMLEGDLMSSSQILDVLKAKETETIKNKIVELYGGEPKDNHFIKTLWKFTSDIVTTNFDNLLESGVKNIKIISTDNSYAIPKNPSFKKLFKLQGRVEDVENLLIFEDDYKSFYKSREAREIKKALKDKTCLFVGFSTDEVYFDMMFDMLSSKRQKYIISTVQNDFSKYGFEIIKVSNYTQLNSCFNEIFKEEIEVARDEPNLKSIADIGKKESDSNVERKPTVCVYTASPINSEIDYSDKIGIIMNQFKKYSVEVSHKILNENNLLDDYGEYDYNFIFAHTNKEKIVMEDEYFMQKSINLDELESMIEVDNTTLFLDKKINESPFAIYDVENNNRIKNIFTPFLHKSGYFEKKKGKCKQNQLNTDLPELIDRKNLNTFVGRATHIENIIKRVLTIKQENRILTIKGAGGVGKTTLISKAVVEMADRGRFKEGIKFVPCEFIKSYDDFENRITYAFDMNNAIYFERQLKEQELDDDRLIILDNVETLLYLDDTVEIKELIRTISDYATIVITSRELLNERDYEEVYELDRLTTDEAEELFLKFYPLKGYIDNRLFRDEILDNILNNNPLAIELITKNLIKGKKLEALKRELNESFFDITSEDIEGIFDKESDLNIERTKSLFHSINYSYQKLSEKEKLALETLSLFPDGLHLENLKNFYNQKMSNDKKMEKTMKHRIHNISDRDIKSLEDKSLVIIHNSFVVLQSIIGRFAEFKFLKRDKSEQVYYYERAFKYNEFLMETITNSKLKESVGAKRFDFNKNNFMKSIDFIEILSTEKNEKTISIYLDIVLDSFAYHSSPNKNLVQKLKKLEIKIDNDLYKTSSINLKYYHGDFGNMFELLRKQFPLNKFIDIKNNLNIIEEKIISNIFHIYGYEGYIFEKIKYYLNNKEINIHDVFLISDYSISISLLESKYFLTHTDFFTFELSLNTKKLDIKKLDRHIKGLYKTEFINKAQLTYTLIKADKTRVEREDIKKLVIVNPFTDGLKSLMFAIKDENNNIKFLYEDAIKKLYHIKYYHVEAILFYSRYLKDSKDDEYKEWFQKGRALADKHHYRYLLHQFNCLDSEVYTDYDENDYPLPEPLDYSGIIKKYGLRI